PSGLFPGCHQFLLLAIDSYSALHVAGRLGDHGDDDRPAASGWPADTDRSDATRGHDDSARHPDNARAVPSVSARTRSSLGTAADQLFVKKRIVGKHVAGRRKFTEPVRCSRFQGLVREATAETHTILLARTRLLELRRAHLACGIEPYCLRICGAEPGSAAALHSHHGVPRPILDVRHRRTDDRTARRLS